MDAYDRIVYRALEVPDVLSDDNQLKAAAVRLIKLTWRDVIDLFAMPSEEREGYLARASQYVVKTAELLRNHELDALIGGYQPVDLDLSIYESPDAEPPLDERQVAAWLGVLLETVKRWLLNNPDALRAYS